jgi:hypothetical protein
MHFLHHCSPFSMPSSVAHMDCHAARSWRRAACRRTARLLRHPLEAKLVVPRPMPEVIFERLGFMRASFMVLSLSQSANSLFFHLPPLRRRAVE